MVKNTLMTMSKQKGAFVGVWIDNNLVYIDTSKHFTSKAQALSVAKDNKQLAIWDCGKKLSIYLS